MDSSPHSPPEQYRTGTSRAGVAVIAFVAAVVGGVVVAVVIVGGLSSWYKPAPGTAKTAVASPRPTPLQTASGSVSDQCPKPGSQAYAMAKHTTGEQQLGGVIDTPQVYIGSVNVNDTPVMVVLTPGMHFNSSLVVCGPNARVIVQKSAVVTGTVVVQGTGAQIVLADGAPVPIGWSATAGLARCTSDPNAVITAGTPRCDLFLPGTPKPSASPSHR